MIKKSMGDFGNNKRFIWLSFPKQSYVLTNTWKRLEQVSRVI